MAGNKRSGRKPKPVALRLSDGSFRHDRDGAKLMIGGTVVKPDSLDTTGSALWDSIVEELPHGVLAKLDTYELTQLCRLADVKETIQAQHEAEPTDLSIVRVLQAITKQVSDYGGKFGLTPSDRNKLKQPTEKPNDPLLKYVQ